MKSKQLSDVQSDSIKYSESLATKLNSLEEEVYAHRNNNEVLDQELLDHLGYDSSEREKYPRMDVYTLAGEAVQDLILTRRKALKSLGVRGASRCNATMLAEKMEEKPNLIKEKQASSARGAARVALAMVLADYPQIDLDYVTQGVSEGADEGALVKVLIGGLRGASITPPSTTSTLFRVTRRTTKMKLPLKMCSLFRPLLCPEKMIMKLVALASHLLWNPRSPCHLLMPEMSRSSCGKNNILHHLAPEWVCNNTLSNLCLRQHRRAETYPASTFER